MVELGVNAEDDDHSIAHIAAETLHCTQASHGQRDIVQYERGPPLLPLYSTRATMLLLVLAGLVTLALARGRDGEPLCPNYNNNGTGYANIEVRFGWFSISASQDEENEPLTHIHSLTGLVLRSDVVVAEVLLQQQHAAAHSRRNGFLRDCRQVQHERLCKRKISISLVDISFIRACLSLT